MEIFFIENYGSNFFSVKITDPNFAVCNVCKTDVKRGNRPSNFSMSPHIKHAKKQTKITNLEELKAVTVIYVSQFNLPTTLTNNE